MRKFNITGNIIPELHYYVDMTPQINDAMELINDGTYFVVNRPRQFGKTTFLHFLEKHLLKTDNYVPILLDFQSMSVNLSLEQFYSVFWKEIIKYLKSVNKFLKFTPSPSSPYTTDIFQDDVKALCNNYSPRKVVLLIDEIEAIPESATIDFLRGLRGMYLNRARIPVFHSIALVGVNDIKALKMNVRNGVVSIGSESPFNIAVDFHLSAFNLENIKQYYMQHTRESGQVFNNGVCEKVYQATNGHPFLVSYLAKVMVDEKASILKQEKIQNTGYKDTRSFTGKDCEAAIQILLKNRPTNFESLYRNASDPQVRPLIVDLLMGKPRDFNIQNDIVEQGYRFGIFDEINGRLAIANQIYAQVLYLHFKAELDGLGWEEPMLKSSLLKDFTGSLDFKKVLQKFQQFIKAKGADIIKKSDFREVTGELLLLAYLDLLVNGKGWTFKQVRSGEGIIDVICTYKEQKEVVELKLWYGEKRYEHGLEQLSKYLDSEGLKRGYLVVFDKRDKKSRQSAAPFTNASCSINKKKINVFMV